MVFYPAKCGTARCGSSRCGVMKKVTIPQTTTLMRRTACFSVPRDPTTGRRVPIFVDDFIQGLLTNNAAQVASFGAGLTLEQDAALITLEGMKFLDHVRNGSDEYEVEGTQLIISSEGKFWTYQLRKLELYKEGN